MWTPDNKTILEALPIHRMWYVMLFCSSNSLISALGQTLLYSGKLSLGSVHYKERSLLST